MCVICNTYKCSEPKLKVKELTSVEVICMHEAPGMQKKNRNIEKIQIHRTRINGKACQKIRMKEKKIK